MVTVFDWCQVAEGGVPPAAVVVALDPQECVLPNLGEVVPRPGVNEFFLVGREERFRDGVVETCSAPSHRPDDAVLRAEVGEFPGGVLARASARSPATACRRGGVPVVG